MKKEPSALIIPFGKHKGVTVAELLAKDPQYAEWVMSQGWLAERFAEIHAAIATRGAGNDDTPEHNQLQARFLDPIFQIAFLRLVFPKEHFEQLEKTRKYRNAENLCLNHQRFEYGSSIHRLPLKERCEALSIDFDNHPNLTKKEILTKVSFEQSGVDVVIKYQIGNEIDWEYCHSVSIELKPFFGDDYPSIMRQMKRLRCKFLVVETYNGRGVSEHLVRQMFTSNDMLLVFVREIEAEISASRNILA